MYIEAVLKGYRLLDVPQNPGLRESLKDKSLPELEQILAGYKVLHNKTDVDTAQRPPGLKSKSIIRTKLRMSMNMIQSTA